MDHQKNLSDFKDFFWRHRLVPQEKAKFYVRWVERFLRYFQNRPSRPVAQVISSYLETMETDYRFADWQVKQAADAILLFAHKYLQLEPSFSTNESLESKSAKSNNISQVAGWKEIFNKLHESMRLRHYSPRTEKSYRLWIDKFRKYWNSREPLTLEAKDVKKYLSHTPPQDRVSASTQNQAFNALLYLFRNILQKNLSDLADTVRARQKRRLPVVLTSEEVNRLLSFLEGSYLLMAQLLYGSGLRLLECIRLRIKDIDFTNNLLTIRAGKGEKDRTTKQPTKSRSL